MAKNLRPKLTHVLAARADKLARNLGVATPAIVTRAHNSGGVTLAVDVQPAINRLVPDEDDEDFDVSEGFAVQQYVPVCWLVGRGIRVKAQLQVGDTVLLVCMDRDISRWRHTGDVSDPQDARLHDYASSVAIPGLVPDTSPYPEPTDAAALGSALDKLIGVLKGWAPVTSDGGAALQAAVEAAFPNVPAGAPPLFAPPYTPTTTKSETLKLED